MQQEFKQFLDKISYTVRFHRVQKNLTQREVARGCKLGFRTYQRIESGEVFPRLDTLLCIAQYLKIPFPVTNTPPSPLQLGVVGMERSLASPELQTCQEWSQLDLALRPLAKSILDPHLKESQARSDLFSFRLSSNICSLSPELKEYFGWQGDSFCIDDYIQGVRPVEIWELAHRLQARVVLTRHAYNFPSIRKACILAVNFVLQTTPDSPQAFGFMVDITSPEEFSRILSSIHEDKTT